MTETNHFKPGETVYSRFSGEALVVVDCNGCVASVRDQFGSVGGSIVGDLTRRLPRRSEVPVGECAYCDENRGGFKPPHDASQNCQSGKRPHCTCDTCF